MLLATSVPTPAAAGADEAVPGELRRWLSQGQPLSYVYSRALGGLIQTGQAQLSGMDAEYLELSHAEMNLIIVIRKARFNNAPQRFFSPGFVSSRLVAGVSAQLENGDWLFLCPRQEQTLLQHGHML